MQQQEWKCGSMKTKNRKRNLVNHEPNTYFSDTLYQTMSYLEIVISQKYKPT